MFHRQSRSTFFWAFGSKVKGKAEEVLLNIDEARFRKSISRGLSVNRGGEGRTRDGGGVEVGNGTMPRTKYGRNVQREERSIDGVGRVAVGCGIGGRDTRDGYDDERARGISTG
jgi:hypothetical protein